MTILTPLTEVPNGSIWLDEKDGAVGCKWPTPDESDDCSYSDCGPQWEGVQAHRVEVIASGLTEEQCAHIMRSVDGRDPHVASEIARATAHMALASGVTQRELTSTELVLLHHALSDLIRTSRVPAHKQGA